MRKPLLDGRDRLELPGDHDSRHAYAQEWFDVVTRVWSQHEVFDHEGRFWNLRRVESDPKPYAGLPPILDAGSSPQCRDFATRNSDVVFTVVMDCSPARTSCAATRQPRRRVPALVLGGAR